MNDATTRPYDEVVLLARVRHAGAAVSATKRRADRDEQARAERVLRVVVLDAYDAGISWQAIGDALGLRRGAAYQRFRRRPAEVIGGRGNPRVSREAAAIRAPRQA